MEANEEEQSQVNPLDIQMHDYIYRYQAVISNLEVGRSVLGNFDGLFVGPDRMFKEGEVICSYEGTLLTTKEALRLQDKSYLMRLGPQVYVDSRESMHILARFINDCINPAGHNVRFEKLPQEGRADVIATRDIYPNEELFVDYGRWYWLGSKLSSSSVDTEGSGGGGGEDAPASIAPVRLSFSVINRLVMYSIIMQYKLQLLIIINIVLYFIFAACENREKPNTFTNK
jgi:hypothetical protein